MAIIAPFDHRRAAGRPRRAGPSHRRARRPRV